MPECWASLTKSGGGMSSDNFKGRTLSRVVSLQVTAGEFVPQLLSSVTDLIQGLFALG